ncbi:ubiquinone-binding protein [Shewanella sp. NFH-SH190041]|uniref:type II toxin-antitoxin system RatA family toxin n=1 Tax=Shewanella sp. NFH-SH190041 TaxID=2950245 RepID=UPI0021C49690|nr:type II toxin-antitoxin system RatA family toxin [Shewanella sp. NFH-SH190041]BDM65206.1 ubiquinone-binding protein [Shewanella sp. NFH-SH190041]
MPKISRQVLVRFSAQQMFDLVNDVESYPQFLPGCSGGEILESSTEHMLARVDISKAGIAKSFTTRNRLIPGKLIQLTLEKGPFKFLQGQWQFTALTDDACKIEFELEFEFSNSLAAMAFGKIFQELVAAMVTAFTERAKIIYAK